MIKHKRDTHLIMVWCTIIGNIFPAIGFFRMIKRLICLVTLRFAFRLWHISLTQYWMNIYNNLSQWNNQCNGIAAIYDVHCNMISTTCLSALTWFSTLNIMHMTFTVTTRNWYKYNKPMLVKRTKNQGFIQLKTPAFMTRQLIRVINKFRFCYVCL